MTTTIDVAIDGLTTADRKALHAYLSELAHETWEIFSESNGVSVTGLLEALGLILHDEMKEAEPEDIRRDWVRLGRKVDAQRRKRKKKGEG